MSVAAELGDWSWPGGPQPMDWPADHPSRPQEAVDYLGWPADHPSRPQRAVDYRGWPADHPSRPQEAVDYRVSSYYAPSGPGVGPGQPVPVGQPLSVGRPLPVGQPGFAGPTSRQPERVPAPLPPHATPLLPDPAAELAAGLAAGQDAEELRSPTDALRVVSLLISGAEAEADKIRAEASALREQATAQAEAVREAAEREAEGLRASVRAMSVELGQVAASVAQRLTIDAEPEAEPGQDLPTSAPTSKASATPTAPTTTVPPTTVPPTTVPAPVLLPRRGPLPSREQFRPASPARPSPARPSPASGLGRSEQSGWWRHSALAWSCSAS